MSETPAPCGGDTELEAKRDYRSANQQILLEVVEVLSRQPFEPTPLARLAKQVHASRDPVFRAVKNLELAGWAEQTPGGGWRLTPLITRISERTRLAIADLHRTYLSPKEEQRDG